MATFITDLSALFAPVAVQIAQRRVALGLPPLVAPAPPTAGMVGALMIGQEWLRREQSPPRIVIVPVGAKYEYKRQPGVQPVRGRVGEISPKLRERRWLCFEAHLWGDPDPTNVTALQDFNACLELEAELLTAIYDNCGGTPNVKHSDSRFEQPTQDVRLGRLFVLPFAIGTDVTDLPYTILPYATDASSGVSVHTTIEAVWNDGTSTIAGIVIAPPA